MKPLTLLAAIALATFALFSITVPAGSGELDTPSIFADASHAARAAARRTADSTERPAPRDAARTSVEDEATALARELANTITSAGSAHSRASGRSAWERMRPDLDRRFTELADRARCANIAFVHLLAREGLEPASLSDGALAEAFDELDELHGRRDRELLAIQFADPGTGLLEQVEGEEVDEATIEVMARYRELERELGRGLAAAAQRPAAASVASAPSASAASAR